MSLLPVVTGHSIRIYPAIFDSRDRGRSPCEGRTPVSGELVREAHARGVSGEHVSHGERPSAAELSAYRNSSGRQTEITGNEATFLTGSLTRMNVRSSAAENNW